MNEKEQEVRVCYIGGELGGLGGVGIKIKTGGGKKVEV